MSSRSILRLYRRCLKSVRRIPSADQRHEYKLYVRDGFRSKRHLPSDSRQAVSAIQDAQEQLERMNYYHSIREAKEETKSKHDDIEHVNTKQEQQTTTRQSNSTDHDDDATLLLKRNAVQEWIQSLLPSLYPDDLDAYSLHLIQEGFDSKEMLEEELLKDDLNFMKKAHRRAAWRQLQQMRAERD